jgi:hypothetical protein
MKSELKLILIFVFVCTLGSAYGQKSKPYSDDDAKVYDGRIQQVKGKVVYLEKNHERYPPPASI